MAVARLLRIGWGLVVVLVAAALLRAEPPREIRIAGTVKSADGKPLAGFRVYVTWSRSDRSKGEAFSASGADGRYELSCPDFRSWGELNVEAPPGNPHRLSAVEPEPTARELAAGVRSRSEIDLILRPAVSEVAGDVASAAGPVAGARVALQAVHNSERAVDDLAGSRRWETTTDARGAFRFASLLPGEYCIETVVPPAGLNLVPIAPYTSHPFTVADIPGNPVRIRLAAGGRITGRVLDAGGKPVSGARVTALTGPATARPERLVMGGSKYSDAGETGADGRFALEGLCPETYQVTVAPPPESGLAPSHSLIGLEVGEKALVTCPDIVLAGAGSVEGVVRTPDGRPVPGVKVDFAGGSATTDAQGRYVIGGLPTAGGEVRLTPPAGSPWSKRSLSGAASLAGHRLRYDWTLRDGVTVLGKVTDAGGRPVAGARVIAACGHTLGFEVTTLTGADGTYRILGLTGSRQLSDETVSNHFYLSVLPPEGVSLAPVVRRSIFARLGETLKEDVVFEAAGAVWGVVKDDQGRPVAGACVKVRRSPLDPIRPRYLGPGTDPYFGVRTDEEGAFKVEQVAAATVCVIVEPPSWRKLHPAEKPDIVVAADETTLVETVLKPKVEKAP